MGKVLITAKKNRNLLNAKVLTVYKYNGFSCLEILSSADLDASVCYSTISSVEELYRYISYTYYMYI